jgi:hypothetical protein
MLGFVTNIGMEQNVGWVERSETQKIKVRNKGNVGFRHLNPTYRSAIALYVSVRSPMLRFLLRDVPNLIHLSVFVAVVWPFLLTKQDSLVRISLYLSYPILFSAGQVLGFYFLDAYLT